MVGPTNSVYHPKCYIKCNSTNYTKTYGYTSSTYYDGTGEPYIRDNFYEYVSVTQTEAAPALIEILIKPEEVFYIILFLILLELHLILEVFAYLIRAPPIHALINFIKEIYGMPIELIMFLFSFCGVILGASLVGFMNKSRIEDLLHVIDIKNSEMLRIRKILYSNTSIEEKISDIKWEIDNIPF